MEARMEAMRPFAMADPRDCDKEWAAYLALVRDKATPSIPPPTNSAVVPASATTRSAASLHATSSTISTTRPAAATSASTSTLDARPAAKDELSPEARRIYEYLVGNSEEPIWTASPPVPSSSRIPESRGATATPKGDPHSVTPSTCSTVCLGTETSAMPMRGPAAAASASTTCISKPATTPAWSPSCGVTEDSIFPETTYVCTNICVRTELNAVQVAVDIAAADLAATAPVICSVECPRCDASVPLAVLTPLVAPTVSTTTAGSISECCCLDPKPVVVTATICSGSDMSTPTTLTLSFPVAPSASTLASPATLDNLLVYPPWPPPRYIMSQADNMWKDLPQALLLNGLIIKSTQLMLWAEKIPWPPEFSNRSTCIQNISQLDCQDMLVLPRIGSLPLRVDSVEHIATRIGIHLCCFCSQDVELPVFCFASSRIRCLHGTLDNIQLPADWHVLKTVGPKWNASWLYLRKVRHQFAGIIVVKLKPPWQPSLGLEQEQLTGTLIVLIQWILKPSVWNSPEKKLVLDDSWQVCDSACVVTREEVVQSLAHNYIGRFPVFIFIPHNDLGVNIGWDSRSMGCNTWMKENVPTELLEVCSMLSRLIRIYSLEELIVLDHWLIPWDPDNVLVQYFLNRTKTRTLVQLDSKSEHLQIESVAPLSVTCELHYSNSVVDSLLAARYLVWCMGRLRLVPNGPGKCVLYWRPKPPWTHFSPTISSSELRSNVMTISEGMYITIIYLELSQFGVAASQSYGWMGFERKLTERQIYWLLGLYSNCKQFLVEGVTDSGFQFFEWQIPWYSYPWPHMQAVGSYRTFKSVFGFNCDVFNTIDSETSSKNISGTFSHALHYLEVGNHFAATMLLLSIRLSEAWVLYIPATSVIQCGTFPGILLFEGWQFIPAAALPYHVWYFSWDPGIWTVLCFCGVLAQVAAEGGIMVATPTYCYTHYIDAYLEQAPFSHDCYINLVPVLPNHSYDINHGYQHDFGKIRQTLAPWDPGGLTWTRLEVKPNFMEGGLSTTCLHGLGDGPPHWAVACLEARWEGVAVNKYQRSDHGRLGLEQNGEWPRPEGEEGRSA